MHDTISEKWTSIQGYPNYQVSSLGGVKSFVNGEKLLRPRIPQNRINGQSSRHLPYATVALYNKGDRKDMLIHRIVAEHFIPNPDCKPQVNHIDGNTLNNIVANLEWTTASENVLHSIRSFGRNERLGTSNNKAKLTPDLVNEIRSLYPKVKSQRKLAKQFGVTQTAIRQIVNNNHWKHI